jgi:hypothetical protein
MQLTLRLPLDRPRWTRTGRVIYERKRHAFTSKDMSRILKTLEPPEPSTSETILNFFCTIAREISIFCVEAILSRIGMQAAARGVVQFLENIANWILEQLGAYDRGDGVFYDQEVYRVFLAMYYSRYPEDCQASCARYVRLA